MENKKLNIWNRLYLKWKFEYRFWHKDFYYGVKNLIKWFPIIWKDRNWDHSYVWEILKVKLKYQAEHISSNGFHLNAKYDTQRIETCIRLIDNIQNEFYSYEYGNYHHSEMHLTPIKDKPGYLEMHIQEIWEKFDDYFNKYPHAYREVTKTDKYIFDNDTKLHIAMNMGKYLHNKARRILFKILEQDIEKWWN
jgi:hypothetical protein